MNSYRVKITNYTTFEIIEWESYYGSSASNVRRNAIRSAYRKTFLTKGDKYKVEMWVA